MIISVNGSTASFRAASINAKVAEYYPADGSEMPTTGAKKTRAKKPRQAKAPLQLPQAAFEVGVALPSAEKVALGVALRQV